MKFTDLTNEDWHKIRAMAEQLLSGTISLLDGCTVSVAIGVAGWVDLKLGPTGDTCIAVLENGEELPEAEWPPVTMTATVKRTFCVAIVHRAQQNYLVEAEDAVAAETLARAAYAAGDDGDCLGNEWDAIEKITCEEVGGSGDEHSNAVRLGLAAICDECSAEIPETSFECNGGSIANKHHGKSCSLYDPKEN